MTCRDEILEAAISIMRRNGDDSFSIADLITEMKNSGTSYQESTIRTHVTSRLCANAADHHAVTYSDLERIGHGCYRIITEAMDTTLDASPSVSADKITSLVHESSPRLLAKAVRIAAIAHEHQVDKSGDAYILHPLRLMTRAQTDDEKIVALLHDVVEDSDWTLEALVEEGFPQRIVDAIGCVTNREREGYDDFISRVLTNPLAVRVKLLDLEDNMDMTRLSALTDKDMERLLKYHAARQRLLGVK